MFKKIALVASLFSAFAAHADIRLVAHLDLTQDGQTKQINFDTEIPKNDYYGTTILHDALGRLGIRVIGISDTGVKAEFFIEDAEGNLISNPTCVCKWDESVSVAIDVKKEDEIIEQVALTVTLSRIQIASGMQEEESLPVEKPFLMQACQWTQNTGQTATLVILDNDKAGDATTVTVTIARNAAGADEKWEKMVAFGEAVYGTPRMQDDTTVKFIFERGDMSADAWLNLLATAEGIFVALRSTVESFTENTARVTIELH